MADTPDTHVRRPLWQGVQDANAFWFPADWLDAAQRQARMLALWRAGCRAWHFDDGDLLCLEAPRRVHCASAPGLVLRKVDGVLCSGPLAADERAGLPAADVGLVQGARLLALRFEQAQALDLSEAIDVDGCVLHDTYDLRLPPATLKPLLDGKSVRDALGDSIPPASEESRDFIAQWRRHADAAAGKARGIRPPSGGGLFGWLAGSAARAVPQRMLEAAARVGARRQGQTRPQPWREALERLAVATGASRMLGFRQGKHLARMMEMFQNGRLEDALRHAIPLGGESTGQSFGTWGPRDNLALSGHIAGAPTVSLGEGIEQHLRALYRQAFEMCDRNGRIDEAVFVLAELLNARQEALDYLVKHGRHVQAAELALGWDMPPAMIIRLLMLAGDTRRAVQVARRDGAFAEAVGLLDKHPELANALRLEWGHALVAAGEWIRAIDVVWPLTDARDLATQWLLAAEQAGEILGARALVQRAMLLPDTLERHAARIEAMADPEGPPDARGALAEVLLAGPVDPPRRVRALAAMLLPAIAADRAAYRNDFTRAQLDRLQRVAGAAFLRADAPAWETPAAVEGASLWRRGTPLHVQGPEAGQWQVFDAVPLAGNGSLVALGEMGVAVVDAGGRVRRRYPVPATDLVLADSGQVALALVRREALWRIARLDLAQHTVTDLGLMALQFFAPRFDGIAWTVVEHDRLLVLDATTPARDVLWHVGELGGRVVAANFFPGQELYLVATDIGLIESRYVLPARRLLPRTTLRPVQDRSLMLHQHGVIVQPDVQVHGRGLTLNLVTAHGMRDIGLTTSIPDGEFECAYQAITEGLLVTLRHAQGTRCLVVSLTSSLSAADIDWAAGSVPTVREHQGVLLFHDETGRLLRLDTATSVVRRASVH